MAIYSTLGLACTLAGILRDEGLLVAAFASGMVLVGAIVLAPGAEGAAGNRGDRHRAGYRGRVLYGDGPDGPRGGAHPTVNRSIMDCDHTCAGISRFGGSGVVAGGFISASSSYKSV